MRVLLLDIDSLRPDHLGCYGYERPVSPTIDRLAADGVRFTECFPSDTPCLPSRTAMATCRFGARTGVVSHFGSGQWFEYEDRGHAFDEDRPLAFRHLSRNGIRTATVSSFGDHHSAYHFPGSFTDAIQPTPDTATETCADVTRAATRWLDEHGNADDWLLHVQYWGVHHPYEEIGESLTQIRTADWDLDWPDQDALDRQQGMTGPRTADLWPTPDAIGTAEYEREFANWPFPDRFETPADVRQVVDGYDASIRHVDAHVARLLDRLGDLGVAEETTVVVTADHGEALGEHGIYADHAMAHPPCQRVPLIVSGPPVAGQNRTVDEQVYQFDATAALCDLFGVSQPTGWDAVPLTPALQDGPFEGRDALVSGHGIFTFGRAVYDDRWVYIRLLHPGVFSHPELFNAATGDGVAAGLELLHDRASDPHLTENLVGDRPAVRDSLRARLADWRERVGLTDDASGADPLAAMAVEEGPFLYVDPEQLADCYRERDRSAAQLSVVERAREFP